MQCPYCAWEGKPEEYLQHYNEVHSEAAEGKRSQMSSDDTISVQELISAVRVIVEKNLHTLRRLFQKYKNGTLTFPYKNEAYSEASKITFSINTALLLLQDLKIPPQKYMDIVNDEIDARNIFQQIPPET